MPLRRLTLLTALLHLYLALRLVPALAPWWPAGAALAAALAASAVLVPLPFLRSDLGAQRGGRVLQWAGLVAMGWFSSLMLLALLRDGGLLVAWVAGGKDGDRLASLSAAAVVVGAVLASLVGLANARRTARVRRIDIALPGLPPAWDGFTIAQLSDLHVGPTIRRGYVQRIVDRVNALQADAVAITGDLVDGSVPELRAHVAPLAGLHSRHGVFVVTGNHEYYAGARPWIAELRRLGLSVLLNEHVVLQRPAPDGLGDPGLVIAGVTDFHAGHFDRSQASDPVQAIAGAPAGAPRILLAHQPRSAPAVAAAGCQLQLSGHTHGGQFWPWNLFVPMQQPFVSGLHRVGALQVYVSRGTGYWGPPKRLGAPSEITLVRLRAAA
nr:metallophosphoesterase [uncultured Xylophilus sp.]